MDEGILRVFRAGELDARHNHVIGKKVYKYDTVGSTNDLAFMHALKGEKEGSVFWARAQTKGRGRLGRSWVSYKDKGLYFSVILRPDLPLKGASGITLLAALAVCKALRKFSGQPFLIKWPNDILIDEKKVCGILTEMDAELNGIRFMVVGVGINTNMRTAELPVKTASSLKVLTGKDAPHEGLLSSCLKEMDSCYFQFQREGISGIIEEARHFSCLWGRQVKINNAAQGIAVDFDEDGSLVVRQGSGLLKHIFAGDVELLRGE